MPPKSRGRGAQARGKGRDGRGANSTNSNQGNGKGTKYRIIGAADSVKTGTEKTVLLQVSNEDGEGHFGQAMGMCLANKEVRGVLHAICKAKFPNVIEHGDQNNTDLLSSDLLKIFANSNGLASLTSGASALTNPSSYLRMPPIWTSPPLFLRCNQPTKNQLRLQKNLLHQLLPRLPVLMRPPEYASSILISLLPCYRTTPSYPLMRRLGVMQEISPSRPSTSTLSDS